MLNLFVRENLPLAIARPKMSEEKPGSNPRTIHDGWQPVDKGYQPANGPKQQNNGFQPPRQTQQTQQVAPPPKKR